MGRAKVNNLRNALDTIKNACLKKFHMRLMDLREFHGLEIIGQVDMIFGII